MNNINTNFNTNIINEELNNSIESPVVNCLQLIKLENVPTEVKDSITRVFENLDTTPTSFAESFSNYGDKSKGIFGIVQNTSREMNIIDSKYPNLPNEMALSDRILSSIENESDIDKETLSMEIRSIMKENSDKMYASANVEPGTMQPGHCFTIEVRRMKIALYIDSGG